MSALEDCRAGRGPLEPSYMSPAAMGPAVCLGVALEGMSTNLTFTFLALQQSIKNQFTLLPADDYSK